MKKLDKKGFVLVETVVVGVVVLSIFVMIYENLIPSIGELEMRLRYDDTDTVYMASTFRNLLMSDANFSSITSRASSNGYVDLTDCSQLSSSSVSMCQALKQEFGILDTNRIVLSKIPYREISTASTFVRGFQDYVLYLQKGTTATSGYSLIMSRTMTFISREDANQVTKLQYYASIPV